MAQDYYETLGVARDAAPDEIKKAFRRLARETHPDANPGDEKAEERFKDVAAAYDVLGDEAKRKEYDEVRAMGPMAGMPLRVNRRPITASAPTTGCAGSTSGNTKTDIRPSSPAARCSEPPSPGP